MKQFQITTKHLLLAALLMGVAIVGGCTNASQTLGSADPSSTVTSKEGKLRQTTGSNTTTDDSGAKIIRESTTLSKKGTNIRVLVNNRPITNYDITKRTAFLRLRRIGGNRNQKAIDELIEEKLKMAEASKHRSAANSVIVDKAFSDFAKRNRMSPKQMAQVLARAGVTAKHFKAFLRVQISWQRTVGLKLRSNTRDLSQSDALFSIRKSGEAKPETREFKLQQIIFVVPKAKRKKLLALRSKEAKSFGQRFTSCSDTINQVKLLRDVSIKELGRILEPELPPEWKEDILKTEIDKTTRVKETAKGIEIIAVCSIRNVSDDRAAQLVSQSKEFASLNSSGNKISDEYLAELRKKATIIYR